MTKNLQNLKGFLVAQRWSSTIDFYNISRSLYRLLLCFSGICLPVYLCFGVRPNSFVMTAVIIFVFSEMKEHWLLGSRKKAQLYKKHWFTFDSPRCFKNEPVCKYYFSTIWRKMWTLHKSLIISLMELFTREVRIVLKK